MLSKLKKLNRKSVTRRIRTMLGLKVKSNYQSGSGSYREQFSLIREVIDLSGVKTALEVGCNQGFLTDKLAKEGIFTVGVDAFPKFSSRRDKSIVPVSYYCLKVDKENVKELPRADLVLLLSVHQYWVNVHGDEYAKDVIQSLIDKANKYFVIEFPPNAYKYGYAENEHFTDGDEKSIRAYAQKWLEGVQVKGDIRYLGKNRMGGKGFARHLFLISKQKK